VKNVCAQTLYSALIVNDRCTSNVV